MLVPNERGLDRALEKGLRHVAIFGSARVVRARNLNRSLDEQFAMFEPTVPRGATRGSTCAPTSRCASATRGRAMCPLAQVVDVGKRLFDLGASQLSLGDTIGVGTAAHVGRPAGGVRPTPGCRTTRSPCTSTTPTGRRCRTPWPPCDAGSRPRRVGRRARRLPLREERHRQPRDRGPGLAADRPRHRARRRSRAAGRTQAWMAAVLGRPESLGRGHGHTHSA